MGSPEFGGDAAFFRRGGRGVVDAENGAGSAGFGVQLPGAGGGAGRAEVPCEFLFNIESEFAFGFEDEDVAPGGKALLASAEVLCKPLRTAQQQRLAAGRRGG